MTDSVAVPAAPIAPQPAPPPGAKKAARDFEAVFLGQMTQMMMGTVDSDGPFAGGHGEEMFRSILAERLGGVIADRGGIGLAPRVLDEIIRLQAGAGHAE